MREIVIDTETTGLDPVDGHRIIELACVELTNHVPTERRFHHYVNPERDVPTEAFNVHGISTQFLVDKPRFAEVADGFLAFIGEDRLVIHNAEFDLKFINAELERVGQPALPITRAADTLAMARRRFPGAQAGLDALCRRFEIDDSARTKHGALLDAELLAEVYLELLGGRQPGLQLDDRAGPAAGAAAAPRKARPPRPHAPSAEELEAHAKLVSTLKDPVWQR